ncbi:MAG: BlaI/MecI/CopY family transcriptional regulator [Bryobacteraceae bacterium]
MPRDVPPPLEMMCLNALWTLGEANVADVRRQVSESRPLAYTTIMTLLERLARKGVVSRRKVGRAFFYTPAVNRDLLQRAALRQFVESFFDGSEAKLAGFLAQGELAPPAAAPNGAAPTDEPLDTSLL